MNIAVPEFGGAGASTGAEFLAAVPMLEVAETIRDGKHLIGFESHDEDARAFNLLRSQLLKEMTDSQVRLIGVTSATPSAGKSFVSLNMAAALSKITDRKVLLCDLDLRRGSILEALDTQVTHDVSEYLRGDLPDWRAAVSRVAESDLYIMPCLKRMRRSGELLTSQRFETLMADLRALPDEVTVICDLPPAFASDDAMLTTAHLDGYVLVVEYGRNTAKQVREAMAMLAPSPCVGTILNRYRGGFFDTYGYGYGDPYGIKNYGAADNAR
ncbi:CpsD/CapB family tyrosine-protein kinase [Qipengyuania sediminis]|uniref:CpsD/CapB family tyrosine-protein kinase n=1 Tax=Qipengyuania sediminis TaxID=1532023 RepID=UPI00105A378A|nr:CpsD/CapB family tyrosine-protein kinase [Qipengyuania sediminis]